MLWLYLTPTPGIYSWCVISAYLDLLHVLLLLRTQDTGVQNLHGKLFDETLIRVTLTTFSAYFA